MHLSDKYIQELYRWMKSHEYYIGDKDVTNALRELADYWDD